MSVGGVTPCESVRIRVNKRRENTRSDDDNTRDRCYRRRDVIVHLDCIFARNSLLLLPLSPVGLPPLFSRFARVEHESLTYDPRSSPKNDTPRRFIATYSDYERDDQRRSSARGKKFGADGFHPKRDFIPRVLPIHAVSGNVQYGRAPPPVPSRSRVLVDSSRTFHTSAGDRAAGRRRRRSSPRAAIPRAARVFLFLPRSLFPFFRRRGTEGHTPSAPNFTTIAAREWLR